MRQSRGGVASGEDGAGNLTPAESERRHRQVSHLSHVTSLLLHNKLKQNGGRADHIFKGTVHPLSRCLETFVFSPT